MVSDVPVRRSSRSALLRALALAALLTAALVAMMSPGVQPQPGPMERSSFKGGAGYWLLGKDGGVFAFGDARYFGANRNQGRDIAGMAATATGNGYWTVDDDGDVFPYGDAVDYGSRPGPEIDDIVGFAARSQGDGYWMVSKDGAVYAFGAAVHFGGANTLRLTRPIVGMAATPSGKGYWLIAGDGGVFAFGDAKFFGSTGNIKLNKPIVDFGPSPSGDGYRFIGNDGGVFAYGDAGFFGSTGAITLNQPIVGFAATATGKGYWLVGEDGGVFAFGDAQFHGSTGGVKLNAPIVAIVATPRIKVAPVAKDDAGSVAEDGSVAIDVQANDTHALPASVSIETKPQHGTATVSAGKVVYTPAANYNGADAFKYKLTDTVGHSATANVSITVTPVNDAPVATPASRSATEDTLLSGSVNAIDVDNDPLTFTKVADPAHGALTLNANGTFTYTPTAGYAGSDSFTFKVSDGKADSNSATVTLTVTAVNDAPTISDVSDQSTPEDTGTGAISVTVGDLDGDTLTLSGSSSNDALVPDANVVIGGSGTSRTVAVTPLANASGTSTISLTVSDGNGGTATDTFVVTVTPVNDAPVATPGSGSTAEDTPLSGELEGSDLESSPTFVKLTEPAHGSVTVNADGTFTYTPAQNYNGPDGFTFKVTDGQADSAPADFSITVDAVNDPPTISDAGAQVIVEGQALTDLTFTVEDVDGDSLSISGSSTDQSLVPNANITGIVVGNTATVTVTPVAGQDGAATITVTVDDGNDGTASDSFVLTIQPDDDPVANDDLVLVLDVLDLEIEVLANDSGLGNGPIIVTIESGTLDPLTEGLVTIDGDGTIHLDPVLGALLVSFDYRVTDSDGDFDTGTVTVDLGLF
ncbi:MAG: Ig-like domain-containing protein [Actinomycetota bacterium]